MATDADTLGTAELAKRLGVTAACVGQRLGKDPARYGATKLVGQAARHFPAACWQPRARWVVPAWAEAVLRADIFGEGDGS